MSYRNNVGGNSSSAKGKSVQGYNGGPNPEQLGRGMGGISLGNRRENEWGSPAANDSSQSDALARQGRGTNMGGMRPTGNSWAQAAANGGPARPPGNSWAQPPGGNAGNVRTPGNSWVTPGEQRNPLGRGRANPQAPPRNRGPAPVAPSPAVVRPPAQQMNWREKFAASSAQDKDVSNSQGNGFDSESDITENQDEDVSDDDDELSENSDDLSDDYDSDETHMTHETRKKSKWFKGLFENLDKLTVDQLNDTTREYHCPACQNGPGAIDWYKGLQPLLAHARTQCAKRAKLHRELSKLLEEELRRRGTSAMPAGEAFGKWRGLREATTDHEIVWPPMVIVMNTLLEQDDNDKWIGMGNQELLEYFSTYAATKARHSYGPQGHRGMSVLIFEATTMGYQEAERLHKHFIEEGTDRDAWDSRRRMLFYPGGKRQLYGYMARKADMDNFNQHCRGKSMLKYEMKSYQEMVVIPLKHMSEENQQLVWLRNKVDKHERNKKAMEQSYGVLSQKLREYMEENKMVRERTKVQYEENKEEMDYQEMFFKEQIAKIQKNVEEKEQGFKTQMREAQQIDTQSGSDQEKSLRKEEADRIIHDQEEFIAERESLIEAYKKKKEERRRRFLEEELEQEKEFEATLTALMQRHAAGDFGASSSSRT